MNASDSSDRSAPKPVRGVQTEDVWAAADAVLAAGDKPTIERVRQQLGRGSPNTVGPMLDQWFSSLASRLTPQSDTDLPPEVKRAANLLWRRAVQSSEAMTQAHWQSEALKLEEQKKQLASEREALAADRLHWEQRLATVSDALEWTKAQLSASLADQDRLRDSLARLALQLQTEQAAIAESHQELARQRQAHEAQAATLRLENQAREERAELAERRWMLELDAARTDAKRHHSAWQAATRTAEQQQTHWQEKERALQQQLHTAVAANEALRVDLEKRSDKIEGLLTRLAQQGSESVGAQDSGDNPKPSGVRRLRPVYRAGRSRQTPHG